MSKTYFIMNDIPASSTGLNAREAWMPKDGNGYYDKVACRYFESRSDKRRWLAANRMRETGSLINPSKHISGKLKSTQDPMMKQRIHQHIQASGGVDGLLKRLQRGE